LTMFHHHFFTMFHIDHGSSPCFQDVSYWPCFITILNGNNRGWVADCPFPSFKGLTVHRRTTGSPGSPTASRSSS
jgi:hypothetical protein